MTGSGAGRDRLAGGTGADTFIWAVPAESTASAPDLILDFQTGEDIIGFSLWQVDLVWSDQFTCMAGEIVHERARGRLEIDLAGLGQADFVIDFVGTPAFAEADLIF